MKKLVLIAAAISAVPAIAAINPEDPGLPQGWNATAAQGYEVFAVGTAPRLSTNDSWASVMCVECHTANPSQLIAAPVAGSGYAVGNGALNRGSHFVINSTDLIADPARGKGNSGGGFGGGGNGGLPRVGGEYEKITAWADSGARSKYGTGAAYSSTLPAAAGDFDMICESCHNILMNVGNQLVVENFDHTTAAGDDMCVSCHATGGGAETYAAFQANGNMLNFNASARKRHHVLQGELLDTVGAPYDPDGSPLTNDSTMWAPAYSKELGNGGKFAAWNYQQTIADGAAFAFRNLWNVSGAGTQAAPDAAGDIGTAANLYCTSCHRPHNAMTKGGAFILRTGTGADYTSAVVNGIRRQNEHNNWVTAKIYGEYIALCAGCHTGYDL